jgi:EAL domain-containing protein (putative c-di-GMP-specific phosphodiesterase class I)
MDTHVERRIQIERDLRSAIATNGSMPHYQPLVSLDGNRIIGFEALARWENGDLGFIAPDVFIPIAEETGLINVLSDQLFRRACFDANAWPATFVLAFNVSPVQLRDPRHWDCDFYRSLGKPDSVRAAWKLKSRRARLLRILESLRL